MRAGSIRRAVAALLAIMISAAVTGPASALSYWLEHGSQVKAVCPGAAGGRPLKIANDGTGKFLITAIAICTDTGDAYKLHFDFLSVQINPGQSGSIVRERLEFDWVGLAIYRPADAAGTRIEWLYDEARMIEGSLLPTDDDPVYFGGFEFVVPKATAEAATHFTFYLTWKGILTTFSVL